ncbi:head-tail connector protein [Mycobacterium phage U2]|uniref:Head fiber protein n=1 Tax=Mycobacterium phage U2 TaxID=260120 RepID=Q5J5T9_9CAUD|nr:head-tail connector protein [Mycobacterium phage U2]APQ42030.1 hypothetical protein SEA_ZEPHYR_16 [Mycobacterium phage Zephyr]AXH69352.1 hypothetical protein SEA_NEHALO_16 [Mycobacterium phage NEHalo]QDB74166.1 hypothetical protein SEA_HERMIONEGRANGE_16 [Mycobacterium phage HermioneGrange]QEA11479.1 hypothetical protein SEA_ANGLERFISH_17 [Mycobacterium phage Anglerfish]QGH75646.1 hypothetical protein SEA_DREAMCATCHER_19 [Mycobacterium phage DreamCatcher]QGJ90623.1 head fiber protein [Mycob
MTAPYNGAVVRGWLGSLSDAEIIAKLADLETEEPGEVEVSWDDVADKPEDFPPAAHTHEAADVTDLGDAALLNVGTAAGTVAAGNHTHSNYVPTTRTVNTKALSANVVLNGADVALTGYEIGTEAEAAVAAADTVNEAIAKLEKRIADLEALA